MKKFISIIICAVMLISALSVMAKAEIGEEYGEYENWVYEAFNDHIVVTYYADENATTVTIPSEINGLPVTTIGDYVFYDCSSITQIVIPDSVTQICSDAFNGCTSLTDVNIPDSVTQIGYDAFSDTAFYNNENNWENGILYIGNYLIKADIDIDYSNFGTDIIKNGTVCIADDAFSGCAGLKDITIPNSVINIGEYAFFNCFDIESISIPDSVVNIGNLAVSACFDLKNIDVDINNANYKSVDGVLFNKEMTELIVYPAMKSQTEYIIPDSVTKIWKDAFANCHNLVTVDLHSDVVNIDDSSLSGCYKLTDINVDTNNINYMSMDGILFNKEMTELITYPAGKIQNEYIIPNSVKTINSLAFSGCQNLSNVTILDNVTNIESQAFTGAKITNITIPSSIKTISHNTFGFCRKLTTVILNEGVTSINNSFGNCDNLSSINIPQSVVTITDRSFENCGNLTDVYYNGTEEQWNKIQIGNRGNESLLNAEIHYNYIPPKPPEISEINIIQNSDNTKSITIQIDNSQDNSNLIVVSSDMGVMLDSSIEKISAGDTSKKVEIPDNTDNVKVFIWESLESMKPLCEAKTKEIQ